MLNVPGISKTVEQGRANFCIATVNALNQHLLPDDPTSLDRKPPLVSFREKLQAIAI